MSVANDPPIPVDVDGLHRHGWLPQNGVAFPERFADYPYLHRLYLTPYPPLAYITHRQYTPTPEAAFEQRQGSADISRHHVHPLPVDWPASASVLTTRLSPPLRQPRRQPDLSGANIPTFDSSGSCDTLGWMDDMKLLVHQYQLSNDEICQLFPLCLRGEETKHMYASLPVDVRHDWCLLQVAWLESYPPLDSSKSPLTVLQDFRNLRVDEKSLMTTTVDKDGRRMWELILFSRRLAATGHRVTEMSPLAKGRWALVNLPSVVRSRLPSYNTTAEPSLSQLCRDLASLDHHTIAAEVKGRSEVAELLASLRQKVSQLTSSRGRNTTQPRAKPTRARIARDFSRPSPAANVNRTTNDPSLKFTGNTFTDSDEGYRLYATAVTQWDRTRVTVHGTIRGGYGAGGGIRGGGFGKGEDTLTSLNT